MRESRKFIEWVKIFMMQGLFVWSFDLYHPMRLFFSNLKVYTKLKKT